MSTLSYEKMANGPFVNHQNIRFTPDESGLFVTADLSLILPNGWEAKIKRLIREKSRTVIVKESSTSRRVDEDKDKEFPMKVVTGSTLKANYERFYDLYNGALFEATQSVSNEVPVLSNALDHGYMINVLDPGQRYERHIDSNGITCLFFGSSQHSEIDGQGGELVLYPSDGPAIYIRPRCGIGIFFDGTSLEHEVAQMAVDCGDEQRVSVIATYYTSSKPESNRPDDMLPALGLSRSPQIHK